MNLKLLTVVRHVTWSGVHKRKAKARRIVALMASVVGVLTLKSEATVYHWQGNTSNDWNTGSNWSPVGVPGPNDGAGVDQGTPTIGLSGANVSYISVGDVPGLTGEVVQAAGTVNIGISMGVGDSGGGTGTYFLQGGTLAFNGSSTPGMIVGGGGTPNSDLFYQTGGFVSMGLQDNITIGNQGDYQINAGGLSCSEMTVDAGGEFNEQGGDVSLAGTVALAPAALTGEVADCEIYSTFSAATLDVGGNGSAGGAGTLIVAVNGDLTVSALEIYNTTGTSATLTNGGTINAGTIDFSGNPSLFVWSNGTLHLTGQPLDFTTGTDPYNHHPFGATLTLGSGQTLAVDTAVQSWEWLSGDGSSVTQNTGSSNSCDSLFIGSTGTPATYTLKGGALSSNNQTEFVGYIGTGSVGGTGVFSQSGGTNTTKTLIVADNAPGTYTLSGGSLSTTTIDVSPTGLFHQSGGSMSFTTFNQTGGTVQLDLGLNLTASTYNLSGGSLTTTAITNGGTPSNLNWTGGSLTLTNQPADLTDGTDPHFHGIVFGNSLTLNSGMSLTITDAGGWWEYLYGNNSSITQNTGSANNTPALYIGNTSGSGPADSYNLNDGSLTVSGIGYIGYEGSYSGGTGAGVVNQGGGAASFSTLYIGHSGSGNYNLTAGTLQVANNQYVGNTGASGTLTISGGSDTTSFLGINPLGDIFMHGGTLTATSTSNATLISQDGGVSSLGALSGKGSVGVGGGASLASMSATQFTQNEISVSNNGLFTVKPNSGFDNSVSTLLVSGTGQLDLNNNHMFINYGSGFDPIANIKQMLTNGDNGGAWNGPGIMSSAAAANSLSYGLGYADSADPGNPAGLSESGQIEVAYTLLGDANLDRTVNGVDFGILAANFNKGVSRWDQGDFNYDNIVNGVDFGELAANFNKGGSGAAVGPSALSDPALVAFAQANGLMADVPEPASAGLLLAASAGILTRRRRSPGAIS
jgi:hypothetical protein